MQSSSVHVHLGLGATSRARFCLTTALGGLGIASKSTNRLSEGFYLPEEIILWTTSLPSLLETIKPSSLCSSCSFLGNTLSARGEMVGENARASDVCVAEGAVGCAAGEGSCSDALRDWLVLGAATRSMTEPGTRSQQCIRLIGKTQNAQQARLYLLPLVKCMALEEFASPKVCVCSGRGFTHGESARGKGRGLLEENVTNSSSCARHGMAPRGTWKPAVSLGAVSPPGRCHGTSELAPCKKPRTFKLKNSERLALFLASLGLGAFEPLAENDLQSAESFPGLFV